MDELRFYWKCLRAASHSSCGFECIISTVLAYSAPLAASVLEIRDQEPVSAFLYVLAPIFAILICFVVAPLRASFRRYRALEQLSARELGVAKARQRKAEDERDELRAAIQTVRASQEPA